MNNFAIAGLLISLLPKPLFAEITTSRSSERDLIPKAPTSQLIKTKVQTKLTESDLFIEPEIDVLLSLFAEQNNDGFGWVAESLGDINGDGLGDFIVTAPFFSTNIPVPAGKFYVYSGGDGQVLNSVTSPGFAVWGYSAKAAGDVNNDGVTDYIVGSFASCNGFFWC